jgi:hypothetical protein
LARLHHRGQCVSNEQQSLCQRTTQWRGRVTAAEVTTACTAPRIASVACGVRRDLKYCATRNPDATPLQKKPLERALLVEPRTTDHSRRRSLTRSLTHRRFAFTPQRVTHERSVLKLRRTRTAVQWVHLSSESHRRTRCDSGVEGILPHRAGQADGKADSPERRGVAWRGSLPAPRG